jgi:AcrR family transcriptional regulator
VREVTLTDIAAGVGMHKSTMLRYFETREEIFLRLTAMGWRDWTVDARDRLGALGSGVAREAADILASTLVERPLFCDLLAHAPLNLERGVSLAAVKDFKLTAIGAAGEVAAQLGRVVGLEPAPARNVVATATGMAGALWQMAAPGTAVRSLFETDPELAHAVVDVQPRLTDILGALITGYLTA